MLGLAFRSPQPTHEVILFKGMTIKTSLAALAASGKGSKTGLWPGLFLLLVHFGEFSVHHVAILLLRPVLPGCAGRSIAGSGF